MKRDRLTFAMIIGIPLIQLLLFGFAINMDPKKMPTVMVMADESVLTRQLVVSFQNSKYFKILDKNKSQKEADELLRRGDVQFVFYFPPDFTTKLIRGKKPELLVEADATDPAATSNALTAVSDIIQLFSKNLTGSLSYLSVPELPINLILHSKYNPDRITSYNIVPGLLGVVLTMTMVVITSLAITRERERGTMESLLAMPVYPLEVILGKLVPYIVVGYIQVILIVLAACFVFNVPLKGGLIFLFFLCFPFFFLAFHFIIGIYVSFSGYAGVGSSFRKCTAFNAFFNDRAWHYVKREWFF